MNVSEYLDDILKDVLNKKIDRVISKLDSKIDTNFSSDEKKKVLEISEYLINNDLTVYNDEPLINIVSMLDDIKTDDSYFYAGSIYYDMALKNQSIDYFKMTIKNLSKCEPTEEINKILSDSYFYIFVISKEEETNISDLKNAKKYLVKSKVAAFSACISAFAMMISELNRLDNFNKSDEKANSTNMQKNLIIQSLGNFIRIIDQLEKTID